MAFRYRFSTKNNVLVRGVTRGDGRIGEEVTQNARTIRSVPLRLKLRSAAIHGDVEVRGEVFIPRDVFRKDERRTRRAGRTAFANPRNAAAGAFGNSIQTCGAAKLDMFAYDLITGGRKPFATHWESLELAEKAGFRVNPSASFASH
jgi:DNA ligase (NAD+)